MKSTRVLIIEDNMDIAENIGDFLEAAGYVPDFAANGAVGLQLAGANTYDVIILDLKLPDIDGIDVCKTLRRNADIYTPVLMLTARDTLNDKLTGFEAGADDYLVKPFALQELAARLKVLTTRGRQTFRHLPGHFRPHLRHGDTGGRPGRPEDRIEPDLPEHTESSHPGIPQYRLPPGTGACHLGRYPAGK